jgi:acetolactate synthase-1/2/3 large subunit
VKMTGAQALIKSLEKEGVDVMFGYPGGQIMPVYDVLLDSKLRHILTRHEQGAAHAADGYARATGKVGVCMSTSGPGATNLVTGVATANMDSVPLVAIAGQVGTHVIGTDAFQEADTTGITLPIVKHNYLVTDPGDIATVVQEAFLIASTGRPGAVVIDMPSDVSRREFDFKYPERKTSLPGYKPTTSGHARQIKEAARRIMGAKRPVIYAGGGVISSGASKELRELAKLIGLPVTTTLMAKGAFPETNRLSLGMLGMHGTSYANYVMMKTDLIVAVGARFDDHNPHRHRSR